MKKSDKIISMIKNIKFPYYIAAIVMVQILFAGYLWGIVQKGSSGIKMNHKTHVADNSVECGKCHALNTANTRFMTFLDHKACNECHDDKIKSKDTAQCRFCHTTGDNKTNLRKNVQLSPLVNFDHKKHADGGIKCVSCHLNGSTSTSVTGNSMIPKMGTCVQCHKENSIGKPDDCQACHIKGFEQARPLSHTPLWGKNHGKDLDQDTVDRSCGTCHTRQNNNSCIDCHRKEKPSSHTLAWRARSHAQRAQLNRESCSTCHAPSECITCHKTVSPVSHTGFWGAPYSRHCVNCHIEGSDLASGGIGRNCGYCHSKSSMSAKHTSKPKPHGAASCMSSCHGMAGGKKPRHPYPTNDTLCISCHR